jgi:anti-sigma factor RsiW
LDDETSLLGASWRHIGDELMSREHQSNPRPTAAELHLEEAETLIWAMLDDRLDDAEMQRLSKMIEEDAAIRARYIDCVQLHVDLNEHFGRAAAEKAPSTVVLANLQPGLPGVPGLPQIVD